MTSASNDPPAPGAPRDATSVIATGRLAHALRRERLRGRWAVSQQGVVPALAAVAVVLASFVMLEPSGPLLAWATVFLAVLVIRLLVGRHVMAALAVASTAALVRTETRLSVIGVLLHTVVGAGLWVLGPDIGEDIAIAMTMAASLMAGGALLFQSMELRAFVLSVAVNQGQVAAWWMLRGPGEAADVIALLVSIQAVMLMRQGQINARRMTVSVRERLRVEVLMARLEAEKRAAEAALREAREAEASKGRFLASASHDLRQPLHALSLFVGTLSPMIEDTEQAKLMDKIAASTAALESLLGNLLDLARFDAGGIEPFREDFDLCALLERLALEFRPQARARGLDLAVSLAPARAHTDELLLERLLRNLLANAIRYTATGGVAIAVTPDDDGWRVAIADTGPGIAAADRRRVFDDFVQLGNPARRREAGIGLGLAIVRRIDRLLGLRLRLATATGNGSRFEIVVPPAGGQMPASPTPAGEALDAWLPPGLRVAVVDDDRVILDAMSGLLAQWRCDVSGFTDGLALLDAVSAHGACFDLVLLDDMLAEGPSGLDVARRLLDSGLPRERIALITGNNLAVRLRALAESGLRFLLKPVDPQTIRAMLLDASRTGPPGTDERSSLPCVS